MGKLEKKKEAKLIHPNSRKAASLVKKKIKAARRETKKQQGHQHLRLLAERFVWFRDHLEPDRRSCSVQEAHSLIERYIARHSAELEQLCARPAGRGPAGRRPQRLPRADAIRATRQAETDEFSQGGFECADLTDEEAVLYLRTWDGQVKLVPQIKTRKFIKGRLAETAESSVSSDDRQVAAESPAEDDTEMSNG